MPRGRPTKYKPEYAARAKELCERGAIDAELAAEFDVTIGTIWQWQRRYPEFFNAVKVGKDVADDRIERSLYDRGVGYTYETEKIFQYQGKIIRAKVIEHMPPDVTACIFWLKNRRPAEWRDKQVVEHDGKITFENLLEEAMRIKEGNNDTGSSTGG